MAAHDHNQDHDHDDGDDHGHDDHGHPMEWTDFARIAFVGVCMLLVWMRVWEPFAKVSVIGIAATLIGGWPIYKEALENLWQRRMTMELSMTIALLAALVIGQFVTVLVIIFFVLIAEVLEGLTMDRGRKAIKHLVNLLPREATVLRAGSTQRIAAHELKIGDVVLVKPGSRLPVDGVVVGGNSAVDQSSITGESMPVEKGEGAQVFAGTINQNGALEVRVTGIGKETAFGKIIEAVEHADKLRAPIQRTADRLAGYLVYFAIGCAILTFIITRNAISTISVIIVAGACGIAAGTPLAVLGAIGRSARMGAIIKGGVYLESLGKVDTVVFDKTGTLTVGVLRVAYVHPTNGATDRDVVEAAAIAERRSEHPLARAILEKAAELSLPPVEPQEFQSTPGRGIVCSVDGDEIVVGNFGLFQQRKLDVSELAAHANPQTQMFVARGGRVLGAIGVADVVRPQAADAIKAIKELGIRTVMLTGDGAAIGQAVARQLQLDEIDAELLPHQKVERVKALRAQGRNVAMVGDGINDAPALVEANVGIAMGAGTDVARESADIVLIGNDLLKLVETVKIARRCRGIILFNFTGTLVVDSIGVGLAACGMLNPLIAALIHVSSELLFILNSARLLPAVSGKGVEAGEPRRTTTNKDAAGAVSPRGFSLPAER